MGTLVCIEAGKRRVFASALEWPGWCRSGRSEEEALSTLAAYAGRYLPVTREAGVQLPRGAGEEFEVLERLAGNATTDFGAPGVAAGYEKRTLEVEDANRLAALVGACWKYLDATVAAAPAELKRGPRGGGRDRDQIADHVAKAEVAYAHKLGVRLDHDIVGRRAALIELLGTPGSAGQAAEKRWPLRYGARRIAWHVLDHAWEIEDKS